MTFMTIFLQMLTLCIPIVGLIVAARAGFLDQKMNTALTRLVMSITLPCMVVSPVGANETLPKKPVLLTPSTGWYYPSFTPIPRSICRRSRLCSIMHGSNS